MHYNSMPNKKSIGEIPEESTKIYTFTGRESRYVAPSEDNPMDQECPKCKKQNCLTRADIDVGNICRSCEKKRKKYTAEIAKRMEEKWKAEQKE